MREGGATRGCHSFPQIAPGLLDVLKERSFDVFSKPRIARSGCNFCALVLVDFEICMYLTFFKEIAAVRGGDVTHFASRGQAGHPRESFLPRRGRRRSKYLWMRYLGGKCDGRL
jgi:hypothetical protein